MLRKASGVKPVILFFSLWHNFSAPSLACAAETVASHSLNSARSQKEVATFGSVPELFSKDSEFSPCFLFSSLNRCSLNFRRFFRKRICKVFRRLHGNSHNEWGVIPSHIITHVI